MSRCYCLSICLRPQRTRRTNWKLVANPGWQPGFPTSSPSGLRPLLFYHSHKYVIRCIKLRHNRIIFHWYNAIITVFISAAVRHLGFVMTSYSATFSNNLSWSQRRHNFFTLIGFCIFLKSLRAERQSARRSKTTNDCLTRSDTGCFIAVHIWQQWASKG